jgi:predicted metalloprotease with PDZ domain
MGPSLSQFLESVLPMKSTLLGLLTLLLLTATPALGAESAIHYRVSFPGAKQHYMDIEATVPTDGRTSIEMMMAVWTPGSYLVREYARHVDDVFAYGSAGEPLKCEKSRKNRWRVSCAGLGSVRLKYRVYCRDMSVRGNWVEADYAMINGAPSYLTRADKGFIKRPHIVRVQLPKVWSKAISALPNHRDPMTFYAKDFDALVDAPMVCGNPAVYKFYIDGKEHLLVNQGEGGIWDGPKSAKDVARVVKAHRDMWGFLPYKRYVFFNMITESGGGLEHKNSTLMMTSRWRSRDPAGYRSWLGLVSHEFFHTWNIKRLRPKALGPFDYENENYTESLWVAEGITSYYTSLLLARAGIHSEASYLTGLTRSVQRLQSKAGRKVQPLSRSSYDAWIKHYRSDENSSNTSISYYTKGAIVSFLLDAKIRAASNGRKSLDHVMRLAYKRYSGTVGFTPAQFRKTAEDVAGVSLKEFFARHLDSTKECQYLPALKWFGLQFGSPKAAAGNKAWLGLKLKEDKGRTVVAGVARETPAYGYGFNVDDEILAVDKYRVKAGQWGSRMGQYKPGAKAVILIARRDELRKIEVVFKRKPATRYQLKVNRQSSSGVTNRKSWLKLKLKKPKLY